MTHTAGRGGRLIRARPILLLILGITFFSGMWSESVDRLWEAQFLTNIGVPAFAGFNSIIWFGILNAGAVVLAIAVAQPLSRRFGNASWRGMTWSLFWLDSVMVATTIGFALADPCCVFRDHPNSIVRISIDAASSYMERQCAGQAGASPQPVGGFPIGRPVIGTVTMRDKSRPKAVRRQRRRGDD
jgi:hypothetical protein